MVLTNMSDPGYLDLIVNQIQDVWTWWTTKSDVCGHDNQLSSK